MKRIWLRIFIFLFFLLQFTPAQSLAISSCPVDDPCSQSASAFDKVSCYNDVVNICSSQRESMAAQVVYLSTKISLTNAKIDSAREKIVSIQKEIEDLTAKIEGLEKSLTKITGLFISRIIATYKNGTPSYLNLLLASSRFADFFGRFKYIQTIQAHDRKLLFQLQNSKVNFQDQKLLREEKRKELDISKKQLEKEQATLAVQKKEKELFLQVTRNSETVYRQNLDAAQREAEGIQKAASILSSAGVAKHVSRGEVIGIMGNTGFSTGPHLHLSVYNLREAELNKFNFNYGYENPANDLVSRQMIFEPNACDDVSASQRETKNIGSGSWDWPMANARISQCFGHTPWSWRYSSGIHNGIDMYDDASPLIKAVDSGNAYFYRGGQSAGNGVFIFHDNGKMSLYWHLQ